MVLTGIIQETMSLGFPLIVCLPAKIIYCILFLCDAKYIFLEIENVLI